MHNKEIIYEIEFWALMKIIYYIFQLMNPKGSSVLFEEIRKLWLGFTMVVYKKIYLEAYINDQYILSKKVLRSYISY